MGDEAAARKYMRIFCLSGKTPTPIYLSINKPEPSTQRCTQASELGGDGENRSVFEIVHDAAKTRQFNVAGILPPKNARPHSSTLANAEAS
jgi:hypothetical protein